MAKKDRNAVLASEERDVRSLAERHGLPAADLSLEKLDRELIHSFPPEFLFRANVVPFRREGEEICLAMADPSDIETVDAVESFLGRRVRV